MELGCCLAFLVACNDATVRDRAELGRAIEADKTLDHALKQADDASHAGNDVQAADILKRTAAPAADEALAKANAIDARTAWGRKEKDALVALARDRKDEVGRYERALRGTDLDEKLAALQKQLEIEQRAAALELEVDRGP